MIEDTKILLVLEQILEAQQEMLNLLKDQGIRVTREYSKNIYSQPMEQEEKDALDEDIDLEWWFMTYGEEPHPAKYMDRQKLGYSKRENDYMHKRLAEIADCKPEVNGGTHVFVNVGKKWCKADKNAFNCFACVPVEQENVFNVNEQLQKAEEQ